MRGLVKKYYHSHFSVAKEHNTVRNGTIVSGLFGFKLFRFSKIKKSRAGMEGIWIWPVIPNTNCFGFSLVHLSKRSAN